MTQKEKDQSSRGLLNILELLRYVLYVSFPSLLDVLIPHRSFSLSSVVPLNPQTKQLSRQDGTTSPL